MLKLSISEANEMFGPQKLQQIMPEVSALYKTLKAEIEGVKIIYACEGGLEIGEKLPKGIVPNIDFSLIETPIQKLVRQKEMKERRKK
jgi:hypothetical protein